MITCSCQHQVDSMDETVDLSLADYNQFGDPVIGYVTYCIPCAEFAMSQGRHLWTFEDEMRWMTDDNTPWIDESNR